jgi:hypothetical protein
MVLFVGWFVSSILLSVYSTPLSGCLLRTVRITYLLGLFFGLLSARLVGQPRGRNCIKLVGADGMVNTGMVHTRGCVYCFALLFLFVSVVVVITSFFPFGPGRIQKGMGVLCWVLEP